MGKYPLFTRALIMKITDEEDSVLKLTSSFMFPFIQDVRRLFFAHT